MLTSQDVISAYKLLLGREPESAAIIEGYVARSDFDNLRQVLLGSSEFAGRLKRHPDLLAIPMVALAISKEARTYRRALERLTALALPLHDRSVLIVGDDAASLAAFFLDRFCRVTISASQDTLRLVEISLASLGGAAASNATLLQHGLADFAERETDSTRYDIVYGEMPETDADGLEEWLDDVAAACADALILSWALAPGRSEGVFMMQSRDKTGFFAVPTRKWIVNQLGERFPFVYALRSAADRLGDTTADAPAMFLASRQALDSVELIECPERAPRIAGRV